MVTVLMLVCMCLAHSMAVKVVVIPQNLNSHIFYHGRMARALSDEGHTVGMLLQSNAKVPPMIRDSAVKVVRYKVADDVPFISTEEASQLFVNAALANSTMEQLMLGNELVGKFTPHFISECEAMLSDDGIENHMDSVGYDIAIVDNAGLSCHVALPYRRNIPFIMYGVMYWEWLFRDPSLPSFVPSLFSSLSDDMSFMSRLQNTCIYLFGHISLLAMDNDIPSINPPITTVDIVSKGIFYFVMDDLSIAYPRPLMPNMQYVGDIMPQSINSLPDNIANFVNAAEHGVIIVSFGSFFDYFPPHIAAKFCSVFHQIPQKVIWKLKKRYLCEADPDKILLLDWLPQNDLLGHDNVKLFISHCGINSVLEAAYHGTPIMGFPLGLDQPYHAARVQHRGMGYQMSIRDFTEDQLVENIHNILINESISANVARASRIMRNKLNTPEKRVSYWVQHLVDHGDAHLRTNAFKLNLFQFYSLDVLLVVLLIITIIALISCTFIRCGFRCIRKCCCTKKTKLD